MAIVLHHTIIRSRDKQRSARFFAELLGLQVGEPAGPFIPVQVNEALTFDFDDRHEFVSGHYAFLVDDPTFDHAMQKLQAGGIIFGSGRTIGWDQEIEHRNGGRTVYVQDPDGHSYELFTTPP
jgi:catechol 2,3-dioxygenase-like lactoylglutathione lyase family enzyme